MDDLRAIATTARIAADSAESQEEALRRLLRIMADEIDNAAFEIGARLQRLAQQQMATNG